MYLVSHDAYTDPRLGIPMPANELVLHPNRVEWFVKRLAYCQAPNVVVRELTSAEYRERVIRALPQLAGRLT